MSADELLNAAESLPPAEKWLLVTKLWARLPPEAWPPPSDEDLRIVEERFAEIDAGTAETIPWEEVRQWMHERLQRHA